MSLSDEREQMVRYRYTAIPKTIRGKQWFVVFDQQADKEVKRYQDVGLARRMSVALNIEDRRRQREEG